MDILSRSSILTSTVTRTRQPTTRPGKEYLPPLTPPHEHITNFPHSLRPAANPFKPNGATPAKPRPTPIEVLTKFSIVDTKPTIVYSPTPEQLAKEAAQQPIGTRDASISPTRVLAIFTTDVEFRGKPRYVKITAPNGEYEIGVERLNETVRNLFTPIFRLLAHLLAVRVVLPRLQHEDVASR